MYRNKSWEARHYWVNQFGIIEHDIFAHIPPQHYVVKWKEGFERKKNILTIRKKLKHFSRTVRKTATDLYELSNGINL